MQLNLSIIEIDNFNNFNEIKNENNIIDEKKVDDDNNDERYIKNLNMEQIEKINRDFKKELHKVYKNKIEEIKNKFNELINEKYNSIENEIEKFSYKNNKNNNLKTININKIDKSAHIKNMKIDDIQERSVSVLDFDDFTLVSKNKNVGEIKDEKVYIP